VAHAPCCCLCCCCHVSLSAWQRWGAQRECPTCAIFHLLHTAQQVGRLLLLFYCGLLAGKDSKRDGRHVRYLSRILHCCCCCSLQPAHLVGEGCPSAITTCAVSYIVHSTAAAAAAVPCSLPTWQGRAAQVRSELPQQRNGQQRQQRGLCCVP
jgi:hypothetical protein